VFDDLRGFFTQNQLLRLFYVKIGKDIFTFADGSFPTLTGAAALHCCQSLAPPKKIDIK
jgi:hypothetical protein